MIDFKLNITQLVITVVIVIALLVGGWRIFQNKVNKLENKLEAEIKLKNALLDTVKVFKNKEGQWVAEKLTIQIKLDDLEKMNGQLTANQKKLIDKIKEVNKDNSIITAALINANFIIDSLKHGGIVIPDTINKTVKFIELKNPDINYNFLVSGVLPFPIGTEPTLFINNLTLPNDQFIEFHWVNDKKKGYPIAFSVTNSNKYVKVYDVNSYAIPTINKDILDPNAWQKIGIWFRKNDRIIGYVIGGAIGAGGTYIIMK